MTVASGPGTVRLPLREEVFETALAYGLSLPESAAAMRSARVGADELARQVRARQDKVWGAVAVEEALLAEAEQRRDAATNELVTFERSRSRMVIIGCGVFAPLALIVGLTISLSIPTPSAVAGFAMSLGSLAFLVWLIGFVSRAGYRFVLRARLKPDVLAAKLVSAQDSLMRALVERGVVPEIRQIVNDHLRHSDGRSLTFLSVEGLYESSDLRYEVDTPTRRRLAALLEQRGGGTIGITGPRGVGKTTLIRSLCPRNSFGNTSTGSLLSIVVSAPVHYDGREFLLYLFATLCRAVLGVEADRFRHRTAAWTAAWTGAFRRKRGSTRPPQTGADGGDDDGLPGATPASAEGMDRLRLEAADRLREIEWQQTYTTGWSGTLRLPAGFAEAGRNVDSQLTRRQRSYPQLTDDLRSFLGSATAHGRVCIGIDELDKIESAGTAQAFLNDLKAVFGVDHCFFLISVSEDALVDFQRRALGFRNVFDSSFDDIVRLPYLNADESRQLLERRIIGLPESFAQLCHCLSGGLPRDLIRVARNLVELGTASQELADIGQLTVALVQRELTAGVEAMTLSGRVDRSTPEATALLLWANQLAHHAQGDLLSHCRSLLSTQVSGSTAAVELLNLTYLSATAIDLFTDRCGDGGPPLADAVEGLAQARQALAVHTAVAWNLVSGVRVDQGLEPLPYPEAAAGSPVNPVTGEPAGASVQRSGDRAATPRPSPAAMSDLDPRSDPRTDAHRSQ